MYITVIHPERKHNNYDTDLYLNADTSKLALETYPKRHIFVYPLLIKANSYVM